MPIGLISDTHDKEPVIDTALRYFQARQVGLVIHCGDWKSLTTVTYLAERAAAYSLTVRGVLGNNDLDVSGFSAYAPTAPGDFELCGSVYRMPLTARTFLAAYHGHHKPTLRQLSADKNCTILLLGHSHKPMVEHRDGKLIVNPGSTAFAIPRRKEWQPTVVIVDTATPGAEIICLPPT